MNPNLFKPIQLESLSINNVLKFALYINYDGNCTLYKNAGTPFTAVDRDRLLKNNTTCLYIREGDLPFFNMHVEEQLVSILHDNSIRSNVKGEILFQASSSYVNELFDDPRRIGCSLARCRSLVEKIINHILIAPNALESLAPIVSHSYYTYVHSVQVAAMCIALASHIHNPPHDELAAIGIGGLLHDFGKVYVPSEIIDKKGTLSSEEWDAMKEHPESGYNFLRNSTELSDISLAIVRQHHEKCNGTGYPNGLTADQIHKYAAIAAVADVYCALTTKRPYRDALPPEDAVVIMEEEMQGSFDPHILRFLKWFALAEREEAEASNIVKVPDNNQPYVVAVTFPEV
jgi:putative nucleotidyltransferase with HDIG domain